MTVFYNEFISLGRKMAEENRANWRIILNEKGHALPGKGWNLTELIGNAPPPTHYLCDFSVDAKAIGILNAKRVIDGLPPLHAEQAFSKPWQDFIKAAVSQQLFYHKNTTNHIIGNILRPIRILATCAHQTDPWNISLDEILTAIEVGNKIQASGKLGDNIKGVIRTVFDAEHISKFCPLYPALSENRLKASDKRAKYVKGPEQLLDDLQKRKREERLPERRAFWELIRIVFTEKPRTFLDELRFIGIKVLIICGLRVGEGVLLPSDWRRTRDYFDIKGKPAGELGGVSQALMLRHFAEKQQNANSDSTVLVESVQYVPNIFADILTEALDRAVTLTEPLRKTLKKQVETGRLLPTYQKNDFVPLLKLYPILTGNPFWLSMDADIANKYVKRYKENFSIDLFDEIEQFQMSQSLFKSKLDTAVYQYGKRLRAEMNSGRRSMKFYHSNGRVNVPDNRLNWAETYLRIGEVEEYIKQKKHTKLSDLQPLKLASGQLQSWELLFLTPKRFLSEERNDGICDITRYFSIGRPDPRLIQLVLGGNKRFVSIFEKYGSTDEDRRLSLNSHSLRHLQNTELFRLGVADTIITKRYNRKSVAQSYEYDHRSLEEELSQIELPPETEVALGEKASIVAKMIKAGKATGPLVDAFKKIQKSEGDDAAYQYLKVEADGFHATPYGHCINSFTVDPCPKNLECFTGCRHLSGTNLEKNRQYLLKLENKLQDALKAAEERNTKSIGMANQIAHAKVRLEGIRKLLATPEGALVFPDGPDLSMKQSRSVLDEF